MSNHSVANHSGCRTCPVAVARVTVHAALVRLSADSAPVRGGAVRPEVTVGSVGW